MQFTVEECRTKAGWIIKPIGRILLNLQNAKNIGTPILITPRVLVVKIKTLEIVIHSYGEIQFKSKISKDEAQKIGDVIYKVLL